MDRQFEYKQTQRGVVLKTEHGHQHMKAFSTDPLNPPLKARHSVALLPRKCGRSWRGLELAAPHQVPHRAGRSELTCHSDETQTHTHTHNSTMWGKRFHLKPRRSSFGSGPTLAVAKSLCDKSHIVAKSARKPGLGRIMTNHTSRLQD